MISRIYFKLNDKASPGNKKICLERNCFYACPRAKLVQLRRMIDLFSALLIIPPWGRTFHFTFFSATRPIDLLITS